MFFSTFVLISVDRKHDRLEQRINLRHGDQTAEVRNMSRLGLKQKQEVAIFLRLLIVGKEAFLQVRCILEMGCHFVLLLHALVSAVKLRGFHDCAPPPRPCDFGSRARSVNPNIAHLSPVQSSSSTDSRFSPCNPAGFSGLISCQLQPLRGPQTPLSLSLSPRAKSSSISRSFSFADMDRYKAVEYLFDCRTDRPSWDDDTVFWRDTGISEEVEDVEARDTGGMTMTDMMPRGSQRR